MKNNFFQISVNYSNGQRGVYYGYLTWDNDVAPPLAPSELRKLDRKGIQYQSGTIYLRLVITTGVFSTRPGDFAEMRGKWFFQQPWVKTGSKTNSSESWAERTDPKVLPLLLLARKYSRNCIFYHEHCPLEMFKFIIYLADLDMDILPNLEMDRLTKLFQAELEREKSLTHHIDLTHDPISTDSNLSITPNDSTISLNSNSINPTPSNVNEETKISQEKKISDPRSNIAQQQKESSDTETDSDIESESDFESENMSESSGNSSPEDPNFKEELELKPGEQGGWYTINTLRRDITRLQLTIRHQAKDLDEQYRWINDLNLTLEDTKAHQDPSNSDITTTLEHLRIDVQTKTYEAKLAKNKLLYNLRLLRGMIQHFSTKLDEHYIGKWPLAHYNFQD